jgi:DNA/RNA endonuclease YhcR with UshA esterase domain
MLKIRTMLVILLLAVLARPAPAQKRMSASEAKDHVGEIATVCGEVASTHYAPSTKGQPTFLNLDKPYPNPVFTILIWGSDRSKFGAPENEYKGKRVCVTGKITQYRGAPEIVADNPGQVKLDSR